MLEVLAPGLFTTVQDLGRYGYRNIGVPVSGAMDKVSAVHANQLVGNTAACAVLEITLIAPTLRFTLPTMVAITGATCAPKVNDSPVEANTPILIPKNSVLQLGRLSQGARVYVSVYGGFTTKKFLGSRSFCESITSKTQLLKGDTIPYPSFTTAQYKRPVAVHFASGHFNGASLSAYKGPEFDSLDSTMQKQLLETPFSIHPQSNRMATMLDHQLEWSAREIITAPVQPGTVQLTPSGRLIVLMRDAQTTGGYARVLQLSEEALCRLAQKRPKGKITFTCNLI